MSDNKSPYLKGAVWLGLAIMLAGGALTIQAIMAEADSINSPRWVGVAAGLMFFNAGITVGLMDTGFNAYRGKWWLAYLHGLAFLSIPLILLMLFNWVAFGPGEREFSMSLSSPFLSIDFERTNEIIGRMVFGVPAFFMDVAFIYVMYGLVVDTFKKDKVTSNTMNVDLEK